MVNTGGKDKVELFIEIIFVSDHAWRVSDGVDSEWIPKSQIECLDGDIDDYGPGDDARIEIPEWLAIQKGFV